MQSVAVLPRILGSLFYYSPADERIYTLLTQLPDIAELYDWPDRVQIETLCRHAVEALPENRDTLIYQYSALFEGQGKMPVPPWGAVYQDRDNLLMSDSTIEYRYFLAEQQLFLTSGVNEPEDQFGLMLLALSALLERQAFDAVKTLLEQHLLPWAYRYLDLLAHNDVSAVYAELAQIARLFLQSLQTRHALEPALRELHF